jgi:hypothetical protein
MAVVYSAVKRFDPAWGDNWTKFVAWSGLTQLREVVSLDGILCPTVFQDLTAEDWRHNVQWDFQGSSPSPRIPLASARNQRTERPEPKPSCGTFFARNLHGLLCKRCKKRHSVQKSINLRL